MSDHVWLKGVPMELRPRYYPRPPLRFKDIDIYIPLEAIENDYDFTEERRVLAECKMWEEYKEKERLEEEERQRQAEELKLLREQEEALQRELELEEQKRLEQEAASLALASEAQPAPTEQEDVSSSLATDFSKTLDMQNEAENNYDEGAAATSSSQPNSRGSPSDESGNTPNLQSAGLSHPAPQTLTTTSESEIAVPQNGYHYVSDRSNMQMNPLYSSYQHQHHPATLQSYYNYYVPHHQHHHPPPVSIPLTIGPQHQPQPPAALIQPPSVQFQSNVGNQGGGRGGGSGSILQPQTIQPIPVPVTSCASAGGDGSSSTGTATNSPAGSEKSSSTSTSVSQLRKVDLNLSDFESDTANPFDNVELKSINDMEVLASILKNNASSSQQHVPNSHTATLGGEPHNSSVPPTGSAPPYLNGGVSPGLSYYHQPTPLYPPTSEPLRYPTWTQNGYYGSGTGGQPPVSTSTTVVKTSGGGVVGGSHIPSPTQQVIEQQQQSTQIIPPAATVNSFTKLHFPFLTSMAASRSSRDRDSILSNNFNYHLTSSYLPHPSGHPSTEDMSSQNPFLSNYIQQPPSSSQVPLSHSPMHQHQYWPSHLSHPYASSGTTPPTSTTPVSANGPVVSSDISQSSAVITTTITTGSNYISGPSAPSGSQHALR